MSRLTGRAWTLARAEIHACAVAIARIVEVRLTSGDSFDAFRDAIAEQERKHRRSVGGNYRASVSVTVDYFVIRTFCDALKAGEDERVVSLLGMRSDYVKARMMTHIPGVRLALEKAIGAEIRNIAEKYDYSHMVGE